MGILIAIIVGGLAGLIAGAIMKTRLGIFWNIVVGLVGALIGNFLVGLFGGPQVNLADPTFLGFGVAVVGSIVLLGLINFITRNRVA